MSIRFIITPYDPKTWETAASDLEVDVELFEKALIDNWPEAAIEHTSKGGLLWSIPDTSFDFRGELQSNRQIVTFGPGDWITYKEFVMWYRRQIPESYYLHLFNSSSMDSLIITFETTASDIDSFVSNVP